MINFDQTLNFNNSVIWPFLCRKLRIFGKLTSNFIDFLYKMVEKEVFEQDYIPVPFCKFGHILYVLCPYSCFYSYLIILFTIKPSYSSPFSSSSSFTPPTLFHRSFRCLSVCLSVSIISSNFVHFFVIKSFFGLLSFLS